MFKGIVSKTIFIVGSITIFLFIGTGYLLNKNNIELINKIRETNKEFNNKSISKRLENSLEINKEQMQYIIKMISKNSSQFLLNYDIEALQESLSFDIKPKLIKAIEIYDSYVDEVFLIAYKKNKNILFDKTLPKEYKNYSKIKIIIYENSVDKKSPKIGTVTLYYDENIIIKQIENLKKNAMNELNRFDKQITHEMKESNTMQN